jgi:aprataxin
MKTKKHYNSFQPKLGFFLHLDDVIEEWCDNEYDSFKVVCIPKTASLSYFG